MLDLKRDSSRDDLFLFLFFFSSYLKGLFLYTYQAFLFSFFFLKGFNYKHFRGANLVSLDPLIGN